MSINRPKAGPPQVILNHDVVVLSGTLDDQRPTVAELLEWLVIESADVLRDYFLVLGLLLRVSEDCMKGGLVQSSCFFESHLALLNQLQIAHMLLLGDSNHKLSRCCVFLKLKENGFEIKLGNPL